MRKDVKYVASDMPNVSVGFTLIKCLPLSLGKRKKARRTTPTATYADTPTKIQS